MHRNIDPTQKCNAESVNGLEQTKLYKALRFWYVRPHGTYSGARNPDVHWHLLTQICIILCLEPACDSCAYPRRKQNVCTVLSILSYSFQWTFMMLSVNFILLATNSWRPTYVQAPEIWYCGWSYCFKRLAAQKKDGCETDAVKTCIRTLESSQNISLSIF